MRLLALLLTLVSQPFVGIVYFDRTEELPRPVHMHVLQIDLGAPGLRFTLSAPAGTRETARQTTLAYLQQEHAQIAVNAHFFLPFPSPDTDAWLIGIAASEGRIFSAFETPEQSFALMKDAPGLNIDRDNHASIVHRDPAQPDGLHVTESAALWTTVSGSAQIVTDGAKTIPDLEWYEAINARTAAGLSRDGRTLTLFTVDRAAGSGGMRVGEVADLLIRDYGVWNALNLDGGGSTTMAMEDPATHEARVINASSDNPKGRSVASSLAIFARRIPNP
jgi:exopolysaccharide biosynthesis protein